MATPAYSAFVSSGGYANVGAAVAANDEVIVPSGTSTISSTIVLNDATKEFYIHGVNEMLSELTPGSTGTTMIQIVAAKKVQIAGFKFTGLSETNGIAIEMANTAPVNVEIANCFFEGNKVKIGGPGKVQIQRCFFQPNGNLDAAVDVDDDYADVTVIGGNISNYVDTPTVDGYHIHARAGRLRVYSMGMQRQKAQALIRIDKKSPLGPHVLAGIRSEGTKNLGTYAGASQLLYVPSTTAEVDVAVINFGVNYEEGDDTCYVADYNGAGTLWLAGINSKWQLKALAKGTCPNAKVVAFASRVYAADGLPVVDETNASLSATAFNVWDEEHQSGDPTNPDVVWVDGTEDFGDYSGIPPLPNHVPPAPIHMPSMDALLPGFVDVTDVTYGATGDGVTDDTTAIQAALNASALVYFPAGNYKITSRLGFIGYTGTDHGTGGRIGGPDPATTRIFRATDGDVLATEGWGYGVLQGLTLESVAFSASETGILFRVDNGAAVGAAQQELTIDDCIFDGGEHGVVFGIAGTQCSENMAVGCTFTNSKFPWAVAGWNALANITYGCTFDTVEYCYAQSTSGSNAGAIQGYRDTATTVGTQVIKLDNSASDVAYFNGCTWTTGDVYTSSSLSAARLPLVLDGCTVDGGAPTGSYSFDYQKSGGLVFIHCDLSASLTINATNVYSDIPVLDLYPQGSTTPYTSATLGTNAVKDALPNTSDAVAPSAPTIVTATPSGVGPVVVAWVAPADTDVAGYRVYRSTSSGSGFAVISEGLVGYQTWRDDTALTGTAYYYTVTTVDESGNESAQSSEASTGASMGDPVFVNDHGAANVYLENSDRTVWITAGGVAPAAGTHAYGACRLNIDLTGLVFFVIQAKTINASDGTPNTTRFGRFGWRVSTTTADWGDAEGSFGNDAGEIAMRGNTLAESIIGGTGTYTLGWSIGNDDYVAVAYKASTQEVWYGDVNSGTGAITWGTSTEHAAIGDPVAGTNDHATIVGTGVEVGMWANNSTAQVYGCRILTAAESTALGVTVPTGYSYATDGVASGPDVPAGGSAAQVGTTTAVTITYTSPVAGATSIEYERSAATGVYTGTPTGTGETDDGSITHDPGVYGTSYYKLRAYDGANYSDWSSEFSVETMSPTGGELDVEFLPAGSELAPALYHANIRNSTPPTGVNLSETYAVFTWKEDGNVVDKRIGGSSTYQPRSACTLTLEVSWHNAYDPLTPISTWSDTRTVLAEPTYDIVTYVDPAGSDSNDGLSAVTPKATLRAAWDALGSLSTDVERKVIIQGTGTVQMGAGSISSSWTSQGSFVIWNEAGSDVTVEANGYNFQIDRRSNSVGSRHRFVDVNFRQLSTTKEGVVVRFLWGSDGNGRGLDISWDGGTLTGPGGSNAYDCIVINRAGDDATSPITVPNDPWAVLPGNRMACFSLDQINGWNRALYGQLQQGAFHCDLSYDFGTHGYRLLGSKSVSFGPRTSPHLGGRHLIYGWGKTGWPSHAFKLHGMITNVNGGAGTFWAHNLDVESTDLGLLDSPGTSVEVIHFGPLNDTETEYGKCLRIVNPKLTAAPGETGVSSVFHRLLTPDYDEQSIYNAVIDHQYSCLSTLGYRFQHGYTTHQTSVFGASGRTGASYGGNPAHCIIGRVGTGASSAHGQTFDLVARNIAIEGVGGQGCLFETSSTGTTLDSDYVVATNLATWGSVDDSAKSLAQWRTLYGGDGNSSEASPAFVDEAGGDFSFAGTSPCYETGSETGLPFDYHWSTRTSPFDIGAIEVSTGTPPTPDPNTPADLTATQDGTTTVADLTWTSGATDVDVVKIRYGWDGASWTTVQDIPDTGTYSLDFLEYGGGTLYVQIAGVNGAYSSAWSTSATATITEPTFGSVPDAPTSFGWTQGVGSNITLSWTPAGTAAISYTVEQSLDLDSWSLVGTVLEPKRSIGANVVGNRTTYFRVVATNGFGDSSPSAIGVTTEYVPRITQSMINVVPKPQKLSDMARIVSNSGNLQTGADSLNNPIRRKS